MHIYHINILGYKDFGKGIYTKYLFRVMNKMVVVYSTPSCPACNRVKNFLKDKKIKFENVDVSKHRRKAMEMIEKSGQMGVPVIDIDGSIIVGYNKAAIERALGITVPTLNKGEKRKRFSFWR